MENRTPLDFSQLPKIVAVDFDGTLVEDNWPNIGKENIYMFETIKTLKAMGVKIILWTSRNYTEGHGDMLQQAVDYCAERGLIFDAVNENIAEVQALTGQDTRKVYADLYIDDKSIPHSQDPLYWYNRIGIRYSDFIQKRRSLNLTDKE